MKTLTMTLAVLAAGTGMLFAQTMLDSDGDGLVSLAEVQAVYPDVTEEAFAKADTSGDGMLDEIELAAAIGAGLIPADG